MSLSSFLTRRLGLARYKGGRAAAIEQVTNVFQVLLGRRPDPEGLESYVENMTSGRQTFFDVFRTVLESPERQDFVRSRRQRATQTVQRLYELILHRAPDDAGLSFHAQRLERGETDLLDLVADFLSSEEFGLTFSRHAPVARQLAESMLLTLTVRRPDPDAITSYANALANGYPLGAFLNELKSSAEFVGATSATSLSATSEHVPSALAVLAQELIAARLAREGCIIAMPPMNLLGAEPAPTAQMASLIRTLAMLGNRRNECAALAGAENPGGGGPST